MEISGASSAVSSTSGSVAIEVQKKTQEIQEQTAQTLVESVSAPDPTSSLGQNIDVNA